MDRLTILPLRGEKTISLHFQLQYTMIAPSSRIETKLNGGIQLQTSSYPRVSKVFLYSNALMAKSLASTVRKPEGQKTSNFSYPRRRASEVQAPPYPVLNMVIEEVVYHSCNSKTFSHPTYSFAVRGTESAGKTHPEVKLNPITPAPLERIPKFKRSTL